MRFFSCMIRIICVRVLDVCMCVCAVWYVRNWYQLRIPVVHAYSYDTSMNTGSRFTAWACGTFLLVCVHVEETPGCWSHEIWRHSLYDKRRRSHDVRIGDTCLGDPYGDLRICAGWTRHGSHIAPQCLNASYWKTQYAFEHSLERKDIRQII